jgi:glycosyltransferase involved in cell wall biosynthesis
VAPHQLTIALVGPLPPPFGGMATQTQQLKRLLEAEGLRVVLVQVNRRYTPEWISTIKHVRALFRLFSYVLALWRAAGNVNVLHVMANSGWSWHFFAAPAIWVAWLRGKPVIINYHGGEADKFFQKSFRWIKPTLAQAKLVAVPSGYLQSIFQKWGFQAQVIPNIVDLERFSRPHANTHSESQRLAFHLIVTRNLEPIYDVATALHAFALVRKQFPEAKLTVAGEGEELGSLRNLAKKLSVADAVHFVGRLGRADIVELYHSADLMINPSLVDNMPISVLEALASEVSVVSTNVGGVPYFLNDREHALLVPPGNPDAMAATIVRLLQNNVLRQRLVRNGKAYVEKYTWKYVRNKWLDAYAFIQK